MSSRRPGRMQRIAYDETPLNSSKIDIDARIGWLLAMSRLHHTDDAFRDGKHFAAALAEAGCPASRSLISRWESGEIPVSYEGMSAYEQALDLGAGRLSSLTGYIRAAIPGVRTRVIRPQLDPSKREFQSRLDELIDKAEDGEAVAAEWQDLGWHLAAVPLVHLRADCWRILTKRIVTVLPRSVKVPYRQYSTAAMNIASIPRAQDFMVEAISTYLADPDVQVLTNPFGLLDRLPTRRAAEIVLHALEHPPTESVFDLAVWVATQKVSRGDFTPEERSHLDMIVLRLWRSDPRRASASLAQLIASLPEGIRSTLTDAASKAGRPKLGYVVEHGEEMQHGAARRLTHELAEAARKRVPHDPTYAEDRMLPRLLREALVHRDSERRHLAALLVSASPFAEAVADELVGLLGNPTCPAWLRGRAATTIRYLGGETHRMRMIRFIADPDDDVAIPLIQAIGHLTFSDFSDQVIRSSLSDNWSARERAKMYALGMTGSPALPHLVSSPWVPGWQRSAARWWLRAGPAVHR